MMKRTKTGDRYLSPTYRRRVMSEAAAASIGLSWAPKVPSLPTTRGSKDSGLNPSNAQESLWKSGTELVDGLFVPSRDPRKANKLARKNVKDTTGKGWFDMPAPSITPELKKDLEILQEWCHTSVPLLVVASTRLYYVPVENREQAVENLGRQS